MSVALDFFQIIGMMKDMDIIRWPGATEATMEFASASMLNLKVFAPDCIAPSLRNAWFEREQYKAYLVSFMLALVIILALNVRLIGMCIRCYTSHASPKTLRRRMLRGKLNRYRYQVSVLFEL